jgi:predicted NUDIX family NTP pyrophosphohydrolase
MKILMENWRRYMRESSKTITKLRIFDFDETIAYTKSAVRVFDKNDKEFELNSQQEYDDFIKGTSTSELEAQGYRFDFSDFSKVKDPKINNDVIEHLKRIVYKNRGDRTRAVYVLTARGDEARQPIKDYLLTVEDEKTNLPLFKEGDFDDIITVTGGSKRQAIKKLISDHSVDGETTITDIAFWDDSDSNIADVLKLRDETPDIQIQVNHVTHGAISALQEIAERKVSAGILPYKRTEDGIYFFLGQAPQKYWTCFKGLVEEGESEHEAAKREFEEESSFSFSGTLSDEFMITGKAGKKDLKIWIVEMPMLQASGFDVGSIKVIDSGYLQGTPEIINVGWFHNEEATAKVAKSQRNIIQKATSILS